MEKAVIDKDEAVNLVRRCRRQYAKTDGERALCNKIMTSLELISSTIMYSPPTLWLQIGNGNIGACSGCGWRISYGARYCPHCGAMLLEDEEKCDPDTGDI